MRSHGFALRVGVGMDIKYKWGPRLEQRLYKPAFATESLFVHLPAEKPDSKAGADKIKSASTERHASTKNFCLWKSFRRNFATHFHFNRARKNLSSSEFITVARVVQKADLSFPLSALSRKPNPCGLLCVDLTRASA